MRAVLVGVIALVCGGCATGAADDTAPRTDSAVRNDSDEPTDASPSDASPDSATTDTLRADSATADSSTVDTSGADTTSDTGTMTDSAVLDSGVADTAVADTSIGLDTLAPDTLVPDTAVPDTAVPDTAVADTATLDAAETPATCPTPLTVGTFDSSADAWTFDGLWRYDSGSASMVAGSTTKYSSTYTQNLTNPASVDLSGCAATTLTFRVRLDDDPGYASKGPDKSERLYVQCSGDGGATWTNLTPSPWPTSQSACATSYCCGGPGAGRSFPFTAQSIILPAACRTATARVRFQAKGSSVWNLQNPGWWVDDVKLN